MQILFGLEFKSHLKTNSADEKLPFCLVARRGASPNFLRISQINIIYFPEKIGSAAAVHSKRRGASSNFQNFK